jgi:alcohol dehydrogenase
MIAVRLAEGAVTVREEPPPERPPAFALIRQLCGGICNTDLELLRGYYGFEGTPGHEFVGEVVECDDPKLLGRRVTGEINLACGACEWCGRGLGRHCPNRTVLGIVRHPGAFRELLTLPERNLHVVPDSLSTEDAVFTEPVAAACEILDQVAIPPGAPVAVLGDGKLGLLISQVLKAHGLDVHQYGRHPEKLRIAQGAGVLVSAGGRLPAYSYDWVVEATGSAEGLRLAAGMVRPRGTVVIVALYDRPATIDTMFFMHKELTMVASVMVTPEDFVESLELRRRALCDAAADPGALERPGADRVHEHAVRRELERGLADDVQDRGLARDVPVTDLGLGPQPRVRGRHHDAAGALPAHHRRGMLEREQHAVQVHAEHRVPVGALDRVEALAALDPEPGPRRDARVREHDVEAAFHGDDVLDERVDARLVGDVDHDRAGLEAAVGERCGRRGEPLGVDVPEL